MDKYKCELMPRRHWIEGIGAGPVKLTGPRPRSEGATPEAVALVGCGCCEPVVHWGCNWSGCVVMRLSLMHCVGREVGVAANTRAESLMWDFRLSGRSTGGNPWNCGKIILAIDHSSEFSSGISISPLRIQTASDISAGT